MAGNAYTAVPLTSNWTFKRGTLDSASDYLPARDVPTEIHLDLLKNNIIVDPFLDLNELSSHWIADEAWTYHTTFNTPPNNREPHTKTVLKFEGLDTFASVFVNGKLILESENMFLEHRIDVSTTLKDDVSDENSIDIVFESARKRGLDLVKKHSGHKFIVHQTEISRGPIRKAQYHWGWDWGPILLTCGPWKPILLETYTYRIKDVWVEYELSDDMKKARGKAFATVDGPDAELAVNIYKITSGTEDKPFLGLRGFTVDGVFETGFELSVDPWWPRGYGPQSLYIVAASLFSTSHHSAPAVCKTIGFRKVELIQTKDAIGTSFYFRINNTDIFAGGSCWIPADSFLTRTTSENYRKLLQLAAEGHQTMIRVWGGGIYESDEFYHACDELGLLVWQDFMFACANYPAFPEYLRSVEAEAHQNVKRLRHHPSLVIWAGNNEDYQIVERYGLEYRFEEDKDPESWLNTDFPARYIYEYLLPKIVRENTNGTPYHPSSPFGNGVSTTLKVDPTVGDVHQWNVWHGDMKPYQRLPEMGGRFVSEFGMEAYPHIETIKRCITREEDRYPGSMAMDFRNKAIGHERRLVSYVAENFRMKHDLPGFTHLTQVMQADTMACAYKSWRRQWGTKGQRQCGGVLVWQLNDCWPTMSWAVIDYNLIPKPAYYAIKRAMKPIDVGVKRKFHDWTSRPADELWKRDTSHIDMRKIWEDVEFDVWISNSTAETRDGKLVISYISIRTGRDIAEPITKYVSIQPNGTTEVIRARKVPILEPRGSNVPYDISKADPFIIFVSLEVGGEEVAEEISWPDPIKYLSFQHRGVNVVASEQGSEVTISAARPVKGFVFTERSGFRLSDNGFDLVPGRKKVVEVRGAIAESLSWNYVGM